MYNVETSDHCAKCKDIVPMSNIHLPSGLCGRCRMALPKNNNTQTKVRPLDLALKELLIERSISDKRKASITY